ncbi:retrotransposon protein, putative, ty1-copia subclass [Tanacetum coccineum]
MLVNKVEGKLVAALCHPMNGYVGSNCFEETEASWPTSSSGIFTIELFAFPNKSWVYDTGCGTHICITKQGFREARKLKQGALYLYVGNGVRTQVEAIRSYDLVLPNGLMICLNNCHYAPSITRGVVSVHRLVENGFVQCFTDFGILVSKNNVHYFNVIPSNGIYEIDMLDLVPNVNSIYNISTKRAKHNLDSTYLWHCRLAHIIEIPMDVEGFEPPQEEEIPIRRSERTRRVPNRLCLNVEAEEHSLGDLNEPTSYKAAMLDSKSNKWIDAMNAEIQSMMDNIVWVLVDLPPGCKTIGTIRILISIAAHYDYEIWQMDVKTAFLNGYLGEDIYMVQPEGTDNIFLGIKIYKDRSKRLIGLGQSAYMDKILKRYKMDNSKRGHIPMQERLDLNKTQGASTPKEVKRMQNVLCASAVAALLIANEPGVQMGARHYHRSNILKVHTDDNLAYPFTKALLKGKLTQHAKSMGLRLASSFM